VKFYFTTDALYGHREECNSGSMKEINVEEKDGIVLSAEILFFHIIILPSRILLETLTVTQLVKHFSSLMEPEASFPCSQVTTISPYSEQFASILSHINSQYVITISLRSIR
jgi:hypothetical protein